MTPPAPPLHQQPQVHSRGNRRLLEFRPGMVQSEMKLSHPDDLVLAYCRAMMCFTLFQPQPAHIVMVGLGGGSLAKFCYRYLPHARITVLELRADVIALRDQFAIPADDARLTIIHADAATYLRQLRGSADVLLVDGFDEHGLPAALGSAVFYADCRRVLRPGGVLATNIFSYDPAYGSMLRRLRHAFGGRLCTLRGVAGNNRIWFAVQAAQGAKATPETRALAMQRKLAARKWLPWQALLNRLLAYRVVWQLQRGGRRRRAASA